MTFGLRTDIIFIEARIKRALLTQAGEVKATDTIRGMPALKEWAVAIQALKSGDQIMIMRKGGLAEETRDFQVKADSFYLYPAYEHQKKELLKEEYQDQIDETLREWKPDDSVTTITAYAKLAEDIEITDQEQIDRLYSFHIWTNRFTEDRLHWKRKNPLHLLLLRIYKLDQPFKVDSLPEYNGCKSWIELPANHAMPPGQPVMNDEVFEQSVSKIQKALKYDLY
ncbi:hypothetical protein SAMN05443246_2317 [Paenibacillus sp. GP183]|nr:hypothetical protein SAMN05443246_2317 [Paenibacillus sp. GP183]